MNTHAHIHGVSIAHLGVCAFFALYSIPDPGQAGMRAPKWKCYGYAGAWLIGFCLIVAIQLIPQGPPGSRTVVTCWRYSGYTGNTWKHSRKKNSKGKQKKYHIPSARRVKEKNHQMAGICHMAPVEEVLCTRPHSYTTIVKKREVVGIDFGSSTTASPSWLRNL